MYADPAEKDTHDAWVDGPGRSLGSATEPAATSASWARRSRRPFRAAYPGGHWERLRGLKRRYDPDNLFRLNHNIPPADG